MKRELIEKMRKVRFVIFDFDGVFTDGSVYVLDDGKEMVRCTRYDGGTAIHRLKKVGVETMVLSGEANPCVAWRCKKIGLPFVQGVQDKLARLKRILYENELGPPEFQPEEICYVGDDLNDLEIMKFVGVPIAVANAFKEIKQVACYVTQKKGGEGAVREVCDLLYKIKTEKEV